MSLGRLKRVFERSIFSTRSGASENGDEDDSAAAAAASRELVEVQQHNRALDAPPSEMFDPIDVQGLFVPRSIDTMFDMIDSNELRELFIGRLLLRFAFEITESAASPGKLQQRKDAKVEMLQDYAGTSDMICNGTVRPRLLTAYVVDYDSFHMPIDTIFVLKGVEQATLVPSGYGSGGTVLRGCSQSTSEAENATLFGNELVFENEFVRFSSTEAVYFNSVEFYTRVVQRVHLSDVYYVARLFSTHHQQRQARYRNAPCQRHGATSQCFFLIPRTYSYRSLIERVHIYVCVKQHQPDATSAIDVSAYHLPSTTDYLIIDCDSLARIVEFIDSRLVNAHPAFDHNKLEASLHPFLPDMVSAGHGPNVGKWMTVWNARNARYGELNKNSGENKFRYSDPLVCSVTCLVYYMIVPEQRANALSPERPRRRPPALMLGSTGTTDEEEETGQEQEFDAAITADTAVTSTTMSDTDYGDARHATASAANDMAAQRRNGHADRTPEGAVASASDPNTYNFSFSRYLTAEQRATIPDARPPPVALPAVSPRTESNVRLASTTTESQEGTSSDAEDSDTSSVFSAAPAPIPPSQLTPANLTLASTPIHIHTRPAPQLPAVMTTGTAANALKHTAAAAAAAAVASANSGTSDELVFHMSSSSTTDDRTLTTV